MVMLYFTFLNVEFKRETIRFEHFKILGLNLILPVLFFLICYPFSPVVALSLFVIGIAPTAAAAPVIAGFFNGKTDFVTTSVLITSPIMGVAIPFLLPLLVQVQEPIEVSAILIPVAQVIFIPLALSYLTKFLLKKQVQHLLRYKSISFYLFLLNVYIASSKATNFILTDENTHWTLIVGIALGIGMLCLILFKIGEWIGKENQYYIEAGLGLARKNTMFAIWVSLTFLSPVVALGPMFYIVFQNLYNSYQLMQVQQNGKSFNR